MVVKFFFFYFLYLIISYSVSLVSTVKTPEIVSQFSAVFIPFGPLIFLAIWAIYRFLGTPKESRSGGVRFTAAGKVVAQILASFAPIYLFIALLMFVFFGIDDTPGAGVGIGMLFLGLIPLLILSVFIGTIIIFKRTSKYYRNFPLSLIHI